ncbi:Rho guanine nucleotide exchange factor (GEF) 17 [Geranomyces variabilis]|nr:Rho guanine nucleotide exchange factor (GEF) 17 [Geranomyces variabilis]
MTRTEDRESLTQPEFESLSRLYALVAHRARRLAILHRHGDTVSVVSSYQELVIDCHSLLALIEQRYFPSPQSGNRVKPVISQSKQFATWSNRSVPNLSRKSETETVGPRFPGAKQLALVQAVGSLKDALNVLSRTIRKLSGVMTTGDAAPRTSTRPNTEGGNAADTLEKNLAAVRETARSILEIASRFETAKQAETRPPLPPPPLSERETRTVNKRASFGSFISRFSPNRTMRSFSDPTLPGAGERSRALGSRQSTDDRRISFAKSLRPKVSATTFDGKGDTVAADFRNVLGLLSNLGMVIGSNLQEFRILRTTLGGQNVSQQLDRRLLVDMEILERCYEDALERVLPLTASLKDLWEQTFVDSFTAIQQLRQVQQEKDQEVARLTKQFEQFQRMNGALLEENTLLKKELDVVRRFGAEPCGSPMSEGARSLRTTPLPSPAIDNETSDPFLPSIAVSPPELDYADITQERSAPSDAVVLSRLYSEVSQAQELLEKVQKRRSSVLQALDCPARSIKHKFSNSLLPKITEDSAPLWKDISHPAMGDPFAKAAIVIQTRWRGYITRQNYKRTKLRLMIVNEMLDTEASYVKGLLTIHKDFMIPLKEDMNSKSFPLSRPDFDAIFRYVEEIMSFNQGLLDSLVGRIAFWHHEQLIGDVFVRAAESMKLYAHFINNYNNAVDTLNRVSGVPGVEKRLQEIHRGLGVRAPNLSDLLISPVQRPPRYLLMLKELLKRTPESHPDFINLNSAVQKVERTVHVINERKKRHGMMKQMQDSFIGNPINLITPGRFLTHSGQLWELDEIFTGAPDHRKERSVFLFNDILVCATAVTSADVKAFVFAWALPICDVVSVLQGAEDGQSIRVSWKSGNTVGVKVLYAKTLEEHNIWLQTLQHTFNNVHKVSRQTSLQGAGLILPPTDAQNTSRGKTLQTINREIQKLESEIQQEAKVIQGCTILESLTNHRDEPGVTFGGNASGGPNGASGGGGSVASGWMGKLNEKMNVKSIGRQKEESQRKLGTLKVEVSRQNILKRELEISPTAKLLRA